MNHHPHQVLLVEDLPVYVSLVESMLAPSGILVESASSLQEGLQRTQAKTYDAILLDLGLPDSQGLDTFVRLQSHLVGEKQQCPIVIFSGLDDEQLAARAVQLGAQDYLIKSASLTRGEAGRTLLVRSITYAIERNQIQLDLLRERSLLEQRVAERTAELRDANEMLRAELNERKRYEFMANTSKDPITLIDRDYCYQAVNDAFCHAQNLSRSQIIGQPLASLWGENIFNTQIKPLLDQALSGTECKFEGWFEFKNLGWRYFEVTYYPFFNSYHKVTHVVVVTHDETVRESAKERIRQSNYRLEILREIDHSTLTARTSEEIARVALSHLWRLVPYDRADVFLFGDISQPTMLPGKNKIAYAMSTTPIGEQRRIRAKAALITVIAGQVDYSSPPHPEPGYCASTDDLQHHPGLCEGHPLIVNDTLKNLQAQTSLADANQPKESPPAITDFEIFLQQSGFRSYLLIPLIAEGQMTGILSLSAAKANTFTTEHLESAQAMSTPLALMIKNAGLLEQLRAANDRLRTLASSLVSAQEDERRRISLELHDEAGQFLTALKLSLALLQAELPESNAALHHPLQEAICLTEETIEKLRSLAHNLRPPALDTVGLNQALADYCQRIARVTPILADTDRLRGKSQTPIPQDGIKVTYLGGDTRELPEHIQTSLYRIAQEALTNVIKHAQATQVRVKLDLDAEQVSLEINDNGQGLAKSSVDGMGVGSGNGIGLLGIRDRAEALGGSLEIESAPGRGVYLRVNIPLLQEAK
jgi:PAS domain S-box-containing protein